MPTSELGLDCVVTTCTFSTPTLGKGDYQAMVEHLKLHYLAVHQNQGESALLQLPQVGSQVMKGRTPDQDGMGGGEEIDEQEVESTEQHDVVTEDEEYKGMTESETGSTPSVEPAHSTEPTEKQEAPQKEVAVSDPEQKSPKVVVRVNLSSVTDQQERASFRLASTAPLSKVISKLAGKLGLETWPGNLETDSLLLRVGEQKLGREQEASSVVDTEVMEKS